MSRKLVAQLYQKSKDLKTSELALVNPTDLAIMKAGSELSFFQMTDNIFDVRLKEKMMAIGLATGLKTFPDEVLYPMVKKFILQDSDFRRLTASQFEQAFTLNISGKLGGDVIEHYQTFNPIFIGKVLNAYIKLEYEAKDRLKHLKAPDPIPTISEQEKADNHKRSLQTIVNDFEKYKVNNEHEILFPKLKLETLEEKGLIKLSVQEKKEFFSDAMEIRKVKIPTEIFEGKPIYAKGLKDTLRQIERGELPDSEPQQELIRNLARQLVIKSFFKKWQEENFNLADKLLSK